MKEYVCDFTIYMVMEEGETEEEARERMYNQLFDGICNAVDYRMDFNMYDGEEREV